MNGFKAVAAAVFLMATPAHARYYEPETGRFLEEDPIPTINQYAYALDNPINLKDPLGLSPSGAQSDYALTPAQLAIVNQNIPIAGMMSLLSGSPFPGQPAFGPFAPSAYASFAYPNINRIGAWDYKNYGESDYFGNFNYGADAYAFGSSEPGAIDAATLARQLDPWSAGGPLTDAKLSAIISGWNYAKAHRGAGQCQ